MWNLFGSFTEPFSYSRHCHLHSSSCRVCVLVCFIQRAAKSAWLGGGDYDDQVRTVKDAVVSRTMSTCVSSWHCHCCDTVSAVTLIQWFHSSRYVCIGEQCVWNSDICTTWHLTPRPNGLSITNHLFIVCVVCLLVVLVKLSLLAKLLARKTPLSSESSPLQFLALA